MGFTSGRHGCFNILKSTNVINHTNKIKKTPQIISIGSEKVFDNIQHPFMIKTLDKPGTEGNLFKRTKGILENTTALMTLLTLCGRCLSGQLDKRKKYKVSRYRKETSSSGQKASWKTPQLTSWLMVKVYMLFP